MIDRIGGRGDGIAESRGRPVYVPFTIAGETVRARLEGRRGDGQAASLVEITAPSAHRRTAPCAHFGTCGGCALQHVDEAIYRGWKSARVRDALDQRGLGDVPVAQVVSTPIGDRRRATLAARRIAAGLLIGFRERRRHRIVDLRECPVLRSDLAALLPGLRELLTQILEIGAGAEIRLAALDGGIDVTIVAQGNPDLAAREAVATFADSADLARIAWQDGKSPPEPVAERRLCTVTFGEV